MGNTEQASQICSAPTQIWRRYVNKEIFLYINKTKGHLRPIWTECVEFGNSESFVRVGCSIYRTWSKCNKKEQTWMGNFELCSFL